MQPYSLFQAPTHAVSFNRVAMLLGDGEADAGFGIGFLPVEHLEKEESTPAFFAIANSKKLRAAFQPPGSYFGIFGRRIARHLIGHFRP
jgi:hypothetical protein